jgi:hypothetical protein
MTKAEVDAALVVADALTAQLAKREKSVARFAAGALLKQQAFTLMVRDYDYVRAALVFPLAQAGLPSVDTFAPSVYVVKKPRRSVASEGAQSEQVDGADDSEGESGDRAAAASAEGRVGLAGRSEAFTR